MRFIAFNAAVLAALTTTTAAEARETGSISGTVSDDSGIEVPGAVVVLSGVELAGERTVASREDGSFRFDGIAPGRYELVVLWKGTAIYKAEVAVVLGSNTPVRVSASLTEMEVIEVVEIQPAV